LLHKARRAHVEAELGPALAIALLVGSRDVDAPMRIVCLLLVLAMDPLSLLLVVAASRTDPHHPRQLMVYSTLRSRHRAPEKIYDWPRSVPTNSAASFHDPQRKIGTGCALTNG